MPNSKPPIQTTLIRFLSIWLRVPPSGLDPHISRAAADYQVKRIARIRNISEIKVQNLVENHAKGIQMGFLGEPMVNVLELNLALDDMDTGNISVADLAR